MNRLLLRDTFFCTLFVMVFLGLLSLLTLNVKIFHPIKKAFYDFSFYDLYYAKFKEHSGVEDRIVLVNVGHLDRAGIARLIEVVDNSEPAVIGLDIIFREPKGDFRDTLLAMTLEMANTPIVSAIMEDEHGHLLQSHELFRTEKSGFINFYKPEKKKSNVVREFQGAYVIDGEEHFSFAAHLASAYTGKSARELGKMDKEQPIKFSGNYKYFLHFEPEEVLQTDKIPAMKGKVVLLGYLGTPAGNPYDIEDKHFTPLNKQYVGKSVPDMFGLSLHANVAKMLIDGKFIRSFPKWVALLLTFLLTFLHLWIFMYYYVKNPKWFHPVAKVVQLISTVLVIWVAYLLYAAGIKIYLAPLLLCIILCVDLIYFYDILVKLLNRKFGWDTYFLYSSH